jgi:hypothetical protein
MQFAEWRVAVGRSSYYLQMQQSVFIILSSDAVVLAVSHSAAFCLFQDVVGFFPCWQEWWSMLPSTMTELFEVKELIPVKTRDSVLQHNSQSSSFQNPIKLIHTTRLATDMGHYQMLSFSW